MNIYVLVAIWAGVLLGAGIGLAGGILGTWASIRNTRTPAERSFMMKCSVLIWIYALLFVAGMAVVPTPYKYFLPIPYFALLVIGIPWMNRAAARLRNDGNNAA